MADWPAIVDGALQSLLQSSAGEAATITTGAAVDTVRVSFKDPPVEVSIVENVTLRSGGPHALVRLADLSVTPVAKAPGSGLTYTTASIRGMAYDVVDIELDGDGGAILHLEEQ